MSDMYIGFANELAHRPFIAVGRSGGIAEATQFVPVLILAPYEDRNRAYPTREAHSHSLFGAFAEIQFFLRPVRFQVGG